MLSVHAAVMQVVMVIAVLQKVHAFHIIVCVCVCLFGWFREKEVGNKHITLGC